MIEAPPRLDEVGTEWREPLDTASGRYQDVGAPARADPNMWDTVGDRVLGVAGFARLEPSFPDVGSDAAPDNSAMRTQK
jgi:hypothetical protein